MFDWTPTFSVFPEETKSSAFAITADASINTTSIKNTNFFIVYPFLTFFYNAFRGKILSIN